MASLPARTARNAGANPPSQPPLLPDSVARAIADPAEVEIERDGKRVLAPGTWKPPEFRILPEQLDKALKAIDAMLTPCGDAGVKQVMLPLMLTHQINNGRQEKQAHDHVRRRRTQLRHAHRLRVPNVNDVQPSMTDRPHLQIKSVLIKYFVVAA